MESTFSRLTNCVLSESTRVEKISVDGRLVETLGSWIEVVSEQHQFARSLVEFLIKVITLGQVSPLIKKHILTFFSESIETVRWF